MLCMASGTRRRAAERLSNRGPGNQTGSAEPGAASRPAPRGERLCARRSSRLLGGELRLVGTEAYLLCNETSKTQQVFLNFTFIYLFCSSLCLLGSNRQSGLLFTERRDSGCSPGVLAARLVPQAARLLRGKELFSSLDW